MKWDLWLEAGSGVLVLQFIRMKTAASGSGGHGVVPRPTCHKALVMLRTMDQFIGSNRLDKQL
jgi:hypothetical protein